MNWKQLKDFCNNLPESELEKNVILWQEENVITDIDARQLEQDYYIERENPENGCFGVTERKELEPDTKIKRVYKEGHPILQENF